MIPSAIPQFVVVQIPGTTITAEVDINLPRIEQLIMRASHNSTRRSACGPVTVRIVNVQNTQTVRQFVEGAGIIFSDLLLRFAKHPEIVTQLQTAADGPLCQTTITTEWLTDVIGTMKAPKPLAN